MTNLVALAFYQLPVHTLALFGGEAVRLAIGSRAIPDGTAETDKAREHVPRRH